MIKEAAMLPTDLSARFAIPELPYGSVWLVGAVDHPRHLSPLAVHALCSADAVIHDPGIAREILDLVQPPRYREVAPPKQSIERAIRLAEDGWRVVQLVDGEVMKRAVQSATRTAERNIPFCVVPNAGGNLA
jgi:siroheme synthase